MIKHTVSNSDIGKPNFTVITVKANKNIIKEWKEAREKLLLHYLRLSLSGDKNIITCLVCGESDSFMNEAAFVAKGVWLVNKRTGMKRTKTIYSNKEFVKWFQDTHFERCLTKFIQS
jgi:hypothetical protein